MGLTINYCLQMFSISYILTIESNVHGGLQTHTSAVLQEMCKTNVVTCYA